MCYYQVKAYVMEEWTNISQVSITDLSKNHGNNLEMYEKARDA